MELWFWFLGSGSWVGSPAIVTLHPVGWCTISQAKRTESPASYISTGRFVSSDQAAKYCFYKHAIRSYRVPVINPQSHFLTQINWERLGSCFRSICRVRSRLNSSLKPGGRWSHDSRNSICMQRCKLLIHAHKQTSHTHIFKAPITPFKHPLCV